MNIAVTALSFCKNNKLKNLLLKDFPQARFWEGDTELGGQDLVDFIGEADAIILGKEKIGEAELKSIPNLRFISKYGVGLDSLDIEALKNNGVELRYSAGVNKRSVAEMTLGFMISLVRNMYQSSFKLKTGEWFKNGGTNLSGKTVGLIGFGHVGQEVYKLLAPFGVNVLVNELDEFKKESFPNVQFVTKERIYAEGDIISLHVPLTETTKDLITNTQISLMQEHAFLINTSRGGIINEGDLLQALQAKLIAGAALDVYATEPCQNAKLLILDNVYCTPHIGGNSAESVEAMGRAAIENLKIYF